MLKRLSTGSKRTAKIMYLYVEGVRSDLNSPAQFVSRAGGDRHPDLQRTVLSSPVEPARRIAASDNADKKRRVVSFTESSI